MLSDNSSTNKRIAKNTIMLYIRMVFLMIINLYTSRVILNALGVDDYGIYNVVGGFVSMFAVVSGSMSNAISRYITFELGKGDYNKTKIIFSTSVNILILTSFIIILIAETVGLWFLNSKMVIPAERLVAANWTFQLAVATFCFNLISVPYNADIIAHERMTAFAYISIVEAIFKLLVAYFVFYLIVDKLIIYALLLFFVSVFLRIIYGVYCVRNFEEANYHLVLDKTIFKEMVGFAGWSFIGSTAGILRDQGGNVLLNLFCGPIVNAARGISIQVSSAVNAFAMNFMTAINPQIIKSYAQGKQDYMVSLVNQSARFSYYLLLIISLPIIFGINSLLNIWLGLVPDYTPIFVQLSLVLVISDSLANPFITVMLATGKIKKYQIVAGSINLLNLPFSYLFLKIGFSPEIVFVIAITISQVLIFVRILLLKPYINISVTSFIKDVYINVSIVTLCSLVLPISVMLLGDLHYFCGYKISLISLFSSFFVIYIVGCKKEERLFIYNQIKKRIR